MNDSLLYMLGVIHSFQKPLQGLQVPSATEETLQWGPSLEELAVYAEKDAETKKPS